MTLGSQGLSQRRTSNLEAATSALIATIRHGSGQSARVEAVLWSCWNGNLCDALTGLDANLAKAVVARLAARDHLAGDAADRLGFFQSQQIYRDRAFFLKSAVFLS